MFVDYFAKITMAISNCIFIFRMTWLKCKNKLFDSPIIMSKQVSSYIAQFPGRIRKLSGKPQLLSEACS